MSEEKHVCGVFAKPVALSRQIILNTTSDGDIWLALFSLHRLIISTRMVWQTSHSTSPHRTNALVKLVVTKQRGENIIDKYCGFGEVGLPPKKKGIYFSDLTDVLKFMTSVTENYHNIVLQQTQQAFPSTHHQQDVFQLSPDPFLVIENLPNHYFTPLRSAPTPPDIDNGFINGLRWLLWCVYTTDVGEGEGRAGRFAVETAVLDLWCKLLHLPLIVGVYGDTITPYKESISTTTPTESPHYNTRKSTCYTVSLSENLEQIEAETRFGREKSDWLKIKLNSNLKQSSLILQTIARVDASVKSISPHRHLKWCIDANTSWSPQICKEMLREVLPPYFGVIRVVEQPFPIRDEMDEEQIHQVFFPFILYFLFFFFFFFFFSLFYFELILN
jgi:hypothetical protein